MSSKISITKSTEDYSAGFIYNGEQLEKFFQTFKKRLFYTQGDYRMFQCRESCCKEAENNTAERDSQKPQIATVCTIPPVAKIIIPAIIIFMAEPFNSMKER